MKNTAKTIRQLRAISTFGLVAITIGTGTSARATDVTARLNSCTARIGTIVRGGVPELLSSNNSRLILASRSFLTVNQAGFEVTASIDAALRSRAAGITLAVEGLSVDRSTGRLALYNWDTRVWDAMVPDILFFPFDLRFSRFTQDSRHYISANGSMRATCFSRSSRPFRLQIDQVKFTVRIHS